MTTEVFTSHLCVVALLMTLVVFVTLDIRTKIYVTSMPEGTTLPIVVNSSQECVASPYCSLNVKSLLLDPPDFYITGPLSSAVVQWTGLRESYSFITPNLISVSHVPVALLASKMIAHDSLNVRRMGVMVFQLRNLLDSIDGVLARERRKLSTSVAGKAMSSGTVKNSDGSMGYWLDGICDTLGVIFLHLACFFYLRRHPLRKRSLFLYTLLPTVDSRRKESAVQCSTPEGQKTAVTLIQRANKLDYMLRFKCSGWLSIIYGFQSFFGSILWNRYIAGYSNLLEHLPSDTSAQTFFKSTILKSQVWWIIVFAWRYVNPHTLVDVLLVAVFFDRMGELLYLLKYIGFIGIFCTALVSETHFEWTKSSELP